MAQKILGYIQLVWTCDSCGTKNPGAIKSCTSCGAPQPPNVRFEKVDASTFDFIKDEALIRMAKSGPDKHCPYCGTRNTASAVRCVQCGSDITVGAQTRQSGEVLEKRDEPVPQPQRHQLPRGAIIAVILIFLVICVFGGILLSNMSKTDTLKATVASVRWQRSTAIEEYQTATARDWISAIPQDARIISCTSQYHYNSDSPVNNSVEVCGEPYTVDTGTGIGQVVQDCYYEVYEDYCSYETMAWVVIDTLTTTGTDLNPYWPTSDLTDAQTIGDQKETYQITFDAEGEAYSLTTADLNTFQMAEPGSYWNLEINRFGNITSAEPAY